MKIKIILSVLLIAMFSSHLEARMSGNQLLEICTAKDERLDMVCQAYIEGFLDNQERVEFLFKTNDRDFSEIFPKYCLPRQATLGQVIDVIIKYMRENPKFRHLTAEMQVRGALLSTFPCRN